MGKSAESAFSHVSGALSEILKNQSGSPGGGGGGGGGDGGGSGGGMGSAFDPSKLAEFFSKPMPNIYS
jgi:hypothetical protein